MDVRKKGMATVWYNQMVEGYNIYVSVVRRGSRQSGENLTYHTNTGTEGVRWKITSEFSLNNAGIAVRAGDTSKIPV